MQARLERPGEDEFQPYYGKYLALVPPGDILGILRAQGQSLLELLRHIPESSAGFAYAPGKWSIKEVVGHLCDAERVFAYRALRFARADRTPLPGFDEQQWMAPAHYQARALAHIAAEFAAVRAATIALLDGLPEEAWVRRGEANGHGISVRALAAITAGHELHHRAVLHERYLPGIGLTLPA
ncbi:MAG: DinB family protein [Gemmatimonadetes bacterium]|nr:DinB family protein [Gemmatimonadota bacterium]